MVAQSPKKWFPSEIRLSHAALERQRGNRGLLGRVYDVCIGCSGFDPGCRCRADARGGLRLVLTGLEFFCQFVGNGCMSQGLLDVSAPSGPMHLEELGISE
jgi:hypothetical protein